MAGSLTIARHTATVRKQTPYFYQQNSEILQSIPNTPYWGVTLSTDLKFVIHLTIDVVKSYQCLAFVRRNLTYCPEKLRRLSYISLIRSKLEYSSSVWDPTCARTFTNWKWSSVGLYVLLILTVIMTAVYHKWLKISTYHLWKTEEKWIKLTLLYKIRNNLICINENGYLERADSRTRDASRNYKLKSDKTELFKHSFFTNTPKIWNNLPSVIKYTQSLEQFKTAVRQHFQ